jgi:hypothetical protein
MATNTIENNANARLTGSVSDYNLDLAESIQQKKLKIFSTKLKIWINDFYLGGKDLYSKQSSTMINCSKALRSEKHTLIHLN